MGVEPSSVCLSVCLSLSLSAFVSVFLLKLSNMNIPDTSGPIAIKFYLKHHLDGRKAAFFGPDRISILVFMATDSTDRAIRRKIL